MPVEAALQRSRHSWQAESTVALARGASVIGLAQ